MKIAVNRRLVHHASKDLVITPRHGTSLPFSIRRRQKRLTYKALPAGGWINDRVVVLDRAPSPADGEGAVAIYTSTTILADFDQG